MTRTALAIRLDAPADRLRRTADKLRPFGGDVDIDWLIEIIDQQIGSTADSRKARMAEALLTLTTCCPAPSELQRAIAMASKLSRYQAGRWRTDRAYATPPPKYGPEDRALFAVLKASPGSGAPRVTTIREVLASARRVAKTLAIPLGNESAD
jgi:hypothetical protein